LLRSGTLQRYIDDFGITGLTSNPTIFDHAIRTGAGYDQAIRDKAWATLSAEDLFFELALEDLRQAADLFEPVFSRTDGVDGWVSLEVSPMLAQDAASTLTAAKTLHARGGKPNLFIKIPGTPEGLPAIEEAIFAGVPVNVTLLFSVDHYEAAAEAYLRGVERRIAAGLNPAVGSVASVFVSRWDVAVADRSPPGLKNQLGLAVAQGIYKSYQGLLDSARWRRAANAGARAQRLLWASTGVKDPAAPDILYAKALAAPFTIDTMPEATLKAFADHGEVGEALPVDGGDSQTVLAGFAEAGVDVAALGRQLQADGAAAFVRSWNDLIDCIRSKSPAIGAGVGQ
jgi:transaldolase